MNKQFFMITLLISSLISTHVSAFTLGSTPHPKALIFTMCVENPDLTRYMDEAGKVNFTAMLMDLLRAGKLHVTLSQDLLVDVATYLAEQERVIVELSKQREHELTKKIADIEAAAKRSEVAAQREKDAIRAALVAKTKMSEEAIAEVQAIMERAREEAKNIAEVAQELEGKVVQLEENTHKAQDKVANLKEETTVQTKTIVITHTK